MTGDIGVRIRNRRKDMGMTQEELGNIVGVTKATINKYETGIVINMKRPTIEKIATALDLDPGYLMGWTDNTTKVHTNNGVIGQNSGAITVNDSQRVLSKEELELLRIYSVLDVKGRMKLLQTAMELEEEKMLRGGRGAIKKWSRDDVIVVYALYCVTPLKKINPSNKTISQVAEILEIPIGSLVLRMRNFQYLDPRVTGEGLKGMSHVAKMDKKVFEEFQNDWGNLGARAEEVVGLALFDGTPEKGARPISSLTEKNKVNRERHFFRASVFASYENKCCITGLTLPTLLVASHIKPYSKCRTSSDRTDPHNGLLLNTFHDKAFDQGLITVTKDYTIRVSQRVKDYAHDDFTRDCLVGLEGTKINLPRNFIPAADCLEYHNDKIFKG